MSVNEVKINVTIDILECEVKFLVAFYCAICDMVVNRFSSNYTSFWGTLKILEFEYIFHFFPFLILIFDVISGPLFFVLDQFFHKNFKKTIRFSFLNSPTSNNLICFCFKSPFKVENRFTISIE